MPYYFVYFDKYCSLPVVHRSYSERENLGARLVMRVVQSLLSGSARCTACIINKPVQEDPGKFSCKYIQIAILREEYLKVKKTSHWSLAIHDYERKTSQKTPGCLNLLSNV